MKCALIMPVALMCAIVIDACGSHSAPGSAAGAGAPDNPASASAQVLPVLEAKDYPSKASAENRALMLTVPHFSVSAKIGDSLASAGHDFLTVDAQWGRAPAWKDTADSRPRLEMRNFFLLIDGEWRIDPDSSRSQIDAIDEPAPGAPPTRAQYVFKIPDHDVHSLELVSIDDDLGTLRVALFGKPPPETAALGKPVANGRLELTVVGAHEVEAIITDDDMDPPSRYLILDLRVRNLGATDTVVFDPFGGGVNSTWVVQDALGNQYPALRRGSDFDLRGQFIPTVEVPPGIRRRGYIAFKVPVRHYGLALSASVGQGPALVAAVPGTGAEPRAAGKPLAELANGNLKISILSAGRTGSIAPEVTAVSGNRDPSEDTAQPRFLVLEAQVESTGDSETALSWTQFALVRGHDELKPDEASLNALPAELKDHEPLTLPPHATRRLELAFVVPPDAWDDLVIRFHGSGTGDSNVHLPATRVGAAEAPATAAAKNIANAALGGQIEYLSDTYGSGYTGRRLLNPAAKESWTPENGAHFPFDIVMSYYRRAPATISAIELRLPADNRSVPLEVEVWNSTTSATDGFTKLSSATIDPMHPLQHIDFPPVNSRYLKLRVLSSNGGPFALELAGIRVLEATDPAYVPLSKRFPDMSDWALSARRAAQLGIDWLEPATIQWQREHRCFGCHVQAQTAMGLLVARRNEYAVSDPLIDKLLGDMVNLQTKTGPDRGSLSSANTMLLPTAYAGMAFSYLDRGQSPAADAALIEAAQWLVAKQSASGELHRGDDPGERPPIIQGSIADTTNASFAFSQAFAASKNPRFKTASDNAVSFIAAAPVVTTQDKVFKILTSARLGGPNAAAVMADMVGQLKADQHASGGWKEAPDADVPSAFATGQVLYGLKQAGVDLESPMFTHGVEYLLKNQQPSGSWAGSSSEFASTMWAVIGLAGSFNAQRTELPPSLERQLDITGKLVLHVNFDFDKATLRPDAAPVLDQVAALLRDHHDWHFEIDGYTDNVGTDDHNERLSNARAHSVMQALIARQVDAGLLKAAGFGKNSPVDTNDTEEGRFQNRRVEIVRQ